jgi:predicted permease
MPSPNRDVRRFRRLLALYPPGHRRKYGAEMETFFLEERARGGRGLRFWMTQVADHVRASIAVRRAGARWRGGGPMRGWLGDLRFAGRSLRRAPGFAAAATITLGLGIGSTTAVYSVLDRVVLRPLPYPDADRLAIVGSDFRHDPGGVGPLSPAQVAALARAPGPADALVAAAGRSRTLLGMGDPERVPVNAVTERFFEMFGGWPAAGRLLGAIDHAPGAPGTAVIDHAFWIERLGGEPHAVGRTLQLDDERVTIVGVLARGFVRPEEVADVGRIWVPARLGDGEADRSSFGMRAVARLRPGATPADLDAHLDRLFVEMYRGDGPTGGTARDYRRHVVGAIGNALGRVLAATALLLVIACVNAASLLLARTSARDRELALRAALGAGRGRLLRLVLAECLLLAATAGALGAGLAFAAVELFRRFSPGGLPRLAEVSVDPRGLSFAGALALLTVLAFGLLPALQAARRSAAGAARAARATPGRRQARLRGTLVLVETAMAVVLVVGAGLLAHDLVRLGRESSGARLDGVVSLTLDVGGRISASAARPLFWNSLLESARGLPGVTRAGLTTQVPYGGTSMMATYTPEGEAGRRGAFVATAAVGGDFLGTLGIPLLEGRPFADTDARGEPVALVNEAFVRAFWPGGRALGRRMREGLPDERGDTTYAVVGVIGDIRTEPGVPPAPQVYLPLEPLRPRRMDVIVRTGGDAAALAPALREIVRRTDPGLPVTNVRTIQSIASTALARPRFYTALFGGFALLALVLALVGVYGTTAYATHTRRRELGIRLALGAARSTLVAGVVGRTGLVLLAGVAIGLAAAAAGSGALGDVLLHVGPRDTITYGMVGGLVLAAGVAAAWVPAGRASRLDPAATLREDA